MEIIHQLIGKKIHQALRLHVMSLWLRELSQHPYVHHTRSLFLTCTVEVQRFQLLRFKHVSLNPSGVCKHKYSNQTT